MSKELVEEALNDSEVEAAKRSTLRVDHLIPGRDHLMLRVIFLEAPPKSAYVVTLYPLRRRRSKL